MAQTVRWRYTGSYQDYTFAKNCTCAFTALSAIGGKGNAFETSFGSEPGRGSQIKATFPFDSGDVTRLIVGGMGTGSTGTAKDGAAGGGGGASMVLLKLPAVEDARWDFTWGGNHWRPLIVVAGGGGTGDESYRGSKQDGAAGDVLHYFSPDNFTPYSTSTSTSGNSGCLSIQNLITNNGAGASYTRSGSTGTGGYGGGGSSDDSPSYGGGWAIYSAAQFQAGSWIYTPTASDISTTPNIRLAEGVISGTIEEATVDNSRYDVWLGAEILVAGKSGVVKLYVNPHDEESAAISKVELYIDGGWRVCSELPTPPGPNPPDPDPPVVPDSGPIPASLYAYEEGVAYCTLSPVPNTSWALPDHVYPCKVRVTNVLGTQLTLTEDGDGVPLTLRVREDVEPEIEVSLEDGSLYPSFPLFSAVFRDPPGSSASPQPSGIAGTDNSLPPPTGFRILSDDGTRLHWSYQENAPAKTNLEPGCVEWEMTVDGGVAARMVKLDSRLEDLGSVRLSFSVRDHDGNQVKHDIDIGIDPQPPELELWYPWDSFLSFENILAADGSAHDNHRIETLTMRVNGGPAQDLSRFIDPETGQVERFTADDALKGGINTVTVTASDPAGNTASRTVKGLHLVFDRTEEDVLYGMKKGFYNATDLNRVGEAETDLAALCRELGHACAVSPKTDWTVADIPTQAQMQAYIGHLNIFKALFPYPDFMPPVPADMNHLDWQKANDMEELLYHWFFMVQSIRDSWLYAGEIYAGEAI